MIPGSLLVVTTFCAASFVGDSESVFMTLPELFASFSSEASADERSENDCPASCSLVFLFMRRA